MKLTNRTIEVSENEEVEIETNKIDQPSKEEYNKDKGHLKKEDSNRHKKGSINKNLNGTLNVNTKAIYSKKYQEINRSDEKSFFNNKKIILYKTEMCRSFTEQGYCKYGERCQFSHSGVELRIINRHPKYNTEVFRVF
ncbi:TISD [Hepatospora eriocheir]|uniref:TISD n=1 Tax=Hepatospora eriocheir TaxID=1081669 RepID=A0A1X0QFF9_9MICR|nr:TISD [Hepatospora eriocheir]